MEIKITSKFKPGDTALRFNESTNKLDEYLIKSIHVQVREGKISIGYHSNESFSYVPENNLFASKEEFINQLTE